MPLSQKWLKVFLKFNEISYINSISQVMSRSSYEQIIFTNWIYLGNWKFVKSIAVLKVKCYQIWVSQTYLLLDKYAHSKNSCQDLNCKNCLEVTNFGKTGGISSWCHQPKDGWKYFWSFIWFLMHMNYNFTIMCCKFLVNLWKSS